MKRWLLPLLLCTFPLTAIPVLSDAIQKSVTEGVTVDLRDPIYTDGVLSTSKGGVVKAKNIRIQAQNIRYIRKMQGGEEIITVDADGDLMLEWGRQIFVADKVHYNISTRTGQLHNARTAIEAWFLGGETVDLMEDGSFIIWNGYFTTCESQDADWQIRSNKIVVGKDQSVLAKSISFRFIKLPIFWFPTYKGSLKSFFDAPITYNFNAGGKQQIYAAMRYRIYAGDYLQAYLRLDYRLRRGPGIGFETEYLGPEEITRWKSRSYIANDGSLFRPSQHTRYRFEGLYESRWFNNEWEATARYDKMSDEDVASDYQQKDFNLKSAGRTELHLRRQTDYTITNLLARVRINTFQTVRQELPTVRWHMHPVVLGKTGILTDLAAEAGYIDFRFANDIPLAAPFNAVRAEMRGRAYRPIPIGPTTLTPELGFAGVYYGNSPVGEHQRLGTAKLAATWNTHFHKKTKRSKQLLTPYLRYEQWTTPSSEPAQHYIFGLSDGWTTLNQLEFGVEHSWFYQTELFPINRLDTKLYSYAFFRTPTIRKTIPWLFGEITWRPYDTTRYWIEGALDFRRCEVKFANARAEWTVNKNFALAVEGRYRGSHDWRKARKDHFMLESFVDEDVLAASVLSDRRNTLLYDLFYRLNPQWEFQFQGRHGWNRREEKNFNEYEVSLLTKLRCAWQLRFSYQRKEHDQKVGLFLTLREKSPKVLHFEHYTSPLRL